MPGRAEVSHEPKFRGRDDGKPTQRSEVPQPSYNFTDKDEKQIALAKAEGIKIPEILMAVCRWAKVGYPVGCTLLHKESYKGENWVGNDPTWMRRQTLQGAQDMTLYEVTKELYMIYRLHVNLPDTKFQAQGMGPTQLTSEGFQLRADFFGGCWLPEKNCMAALGWWREQMDAGLPHVDIAAKYNGSEEYGLHFMELLADWQVAVKP